MDNPVCKNCRFVVPVKTSIVGQWVGECHKNPPDVVIIPSPRGIEMRIQFPIVPETLHCFCHEFPVKNPTNQKL